MNKQEVVVLDGVPISMRDGAVLRADVYLPTGDEHQSPAILVRTTYGRKTSGDSIDPYYFARHGYAVVLQDVRGRYDSDGEFYHGVAEVEDGHDTIEWIAAQDWSNGRVGMTGISYLAAVQCAAACSGSPHLGSLFHVKAPFNYYLNGNRNFGTFHMYMVGITFFFAASGKEARGDPLLAGRLLESFHHAEEWLRRVPLKPGVNPLSETPSIERWLLDMQDHEMYDDFWRQVVLWQPCEHLDRYADIPGCYVGGWYDMYEESHFFEALGKRNSSRTQLLVGPWVHHGFGRVSGDVDFGEAARITTADYMALQLRWFDSTLKNGASPFNSRVRIFVMGGGSGRKTADGHLDHGGAWRDEPEWPIARAQQARYFLRGRGVLAASGPESTDPTRSSYVYDPDDPTPTIGGTSFFINRAKAPGQPDQSKWELFVPHAGQDQRYWSGGESIPLNARHDVLTFETHGLVDPVEVTGAVTCSLWITSTALDTDFIIRLIDKYPPNRDYPHGYALNLAQAVLRAKFRGGFDRIELLEPGEPARLDLVMNATSNLFAAGHRIRIDITSSSYPEIDPNRNTGVGTTGAHLPSVRAVNSVLHSPDYPSWIELPIVTP